MQSITQIRELLNTAPLIGPCLGLFGLFYFPISKEFSFILSFVGCISFTSILFHAAYISNFSPANCIIQSTSIIIWMFATIGIAPSLIGFNSIWPEMSLLKSISILILLAISSAIFSIYIIKRRNNKSNLIIIDLDRGTWRLDAENGLQHTPWWGAFIVATLPPSIMLFIRRSDAHQEYNILMITMLGLLFTAIFPFLMIKNILPIIEALKTEFKSGKHLVRDDYRAIRDLRNKHWLGSKFSK